MSIDFDSMWKISCPRCGAPQAHVIPDDYEPGSTLSCSECGHEFDGPEPPAPKKTFGQHVAAILDRKSPWRGPLEILAIIAFFALLSKCDGVW